MNYTEALSLRIENTIEDAIQAFIENKADFKLDLAELKLRVKLQGPKWAGIVDKPIAKFLIDLDSMLTDELRSQGIEIPENHHGLVALEIQDGSLEAFIKYSKGILQQFGKLKPAQQIMILATILGALGIYMAPAIIEALKQADIEEVRSKERVELVQSVAAISERAHQTQAPLRGLVNRMSDEDQILLPSNPQPVKKQEAKEELVKGTRSRPKTFFVDHPFKVTDLLTKDPENWQIGLSYGDVSFRARIMLTQEQVSQLMSDFQDAHEKGSAIAPNMHITMEISEKGIRSASLVGLGQPREEAVSLSDALKAAGAL